MISSVIHWIRADFKLFPTRFVLEVVAWAISVSCALLMAFTVPLPPMDLLYPLFITSCSIFGWAAWTRKSFGMLANYCLMILIDVFGFIRLMLL